MPHHPHTAATARIESLDGDVLGAGFLVDDQHLLTCGHLFEEETEGARVRFLAQPDPPLEVEVIERWVGDREDLAVLRLVGPRPDDAAPVGLEPCEAGGRFLAQGFPGGGGPERDAAGDVPTGEEGSSVQGSILLSNFRGWVQLETDGARTVHPGFSGAAVWSEAQRAVVGMVVARADDEVAFMIPQGVLRSLWPSLPQSDDYRCMAEPPEGYVPRGEYRKVLDHLVEAGGGTRAALTTGLRGAGGFGKTTLAQALCQDPQVRQIFPDGVLWATLGDDLQEGDRLAAVRDLLRWWSGTEPPAFDRVPAAAAGLRDALHGKRVLVVVDDVWDPQDLEPFQRLPATCGLLVTTRDSRNLPADCAAFEIDEMEAEEASQLLGSGLPPVDGDRLATLADRLGEWPLLLGIVNRQLRDLVQREELSGAEALTEIEEALEEEGLVAFDRDDTEARDRAVRRTLEVSLRRLGEDRELYERLAVFPEDVDIPLAVVSLLWNRSKSATRRLARRLHRLSLLRHFDARQGTLRLHDVLREYLRDARRDDLPNLHSVLLHRLRPASGHWPDLDPGLAYPWHHLTYHLRQAGNEEELRHLLLDYRWLRAKLEATDVLSLRLDFRGREDQPGDSETKVLAGALRLASHILSRDRAQLPAQLWGRLPPTGSLKDLLDAAATATSGIWLRPRHPSFTSPGGPLLSTLEGHEGGVTVVAVLPDGRLVSGSRDRTLRIWDCESGNSLARLEGHEHMVTSVAVLPDGRLVSASGDHTLRIWDPDTGSSLVRLKGHEASINVVAMLPNGRLISASDDGTLRIWHPDSRKSLERLEGHEGWVDGVVVLPDERVVSASADHTLCIWNTHSGNCLNRLYGHEDRVTAVAVLPGGLLVSASADHTLRIWDPDIESSLLRLEGHEDCVRTVAVLRDGRIVSGSDDGTLRIWDPQSGKSLTCLKGHERWVTSVAVLPDGRLVSASTDSTLRIWNPDSGNTLALLEGHERWVRAVAVLHDGRLVSGSDDGTLRIWDPQPGNPFPRLKGHENRVTVVALLHEDRLLSSSEDGTLRIWDPESGNPLERLEVLSAQDIAVLSDHRIVIATYNTLRIWDLTSKSLIAQYEGHENWVTAVAVLPDERLVSASLDGTLRIWDPDSGKTLARLEGHEGPVEAFTLLPNGRLVSASQDRTLRIWSTNSGDSLARLPKMGILRPAASTLALLADGRFVSGFQDGKLLIWDPAGRPLARLEGHEDWVTASAVLQDGRLVSASADRTLRIWDPDSEKCLCTVTLDRTLSALACDTEGLSIFAGDKGGTIHFLEVEGT